MFPARQIEWVVLDTLIKANDPSPFPALTQIELWGERFATEATAVNKGGNPKVSGYTQDILRWTVENGIITGKGSGIPDPKK